MGIVETVFQSSSFISSTSVAEVFDSTSSPSESTADVGVSTASPSQPQDQGKDPESDQEGRGTTENPESSRILTLSPTNSPTPSPTSTSINEYEVRIEALVSQVQ